MINGTRMTNQRHDPVTMRGTGRFYSSAFPAKSIKLPDRYSAVLHFSILPELQTAAEDIISNPQTIEVSQDRDADHWQLGLEWPAVLWIGLLHVGALAAPFCFTWYGLWAALLLSYVSGALGVCLGYHRLLTHASFETFPFVRRLLALCGTLAGEGPPIMWVSAHRKHHRFSDGEHDPHSPKDGKWWSHMLWTFPRHGSNYWAQLYRQYSPDLLKDPWLRMFDRTFLWWHLGLGLILLAWGWAVWDLRTGISFVVYGMFVRLVYVLHVTWSVNSASHIWGYRNYETRDNSRNLWWVGLLAFGEGWHNNHHAYPRSAPHGHRWWELDMTHWVIRLMERTGLAWNVVPKPAMSSRSAEVPIDAVDGENIGP